MSKKAEEKIEKGYRCGCGKYHEYPAYLYAHWYEHITHTCECGRPNALCEGKAEIGELPYDGTVTAAAVTPGATRVRFIRAHPSMKPLLQTHIGEEALVKSVGHDDKLLLRFERSDGCYGQYWVGVRYLELAQPLEEKTQ